jgi:hypothetical protein
MKKLLYFVPVLLVMLLAACSNQDFGDQSDANAVNVSFTTELPGQITSRGWGDGLTATNLSWAVYLKDTKTLVKKGTATLSKLKTSVSISLIKGRSYDVVFWAQSPDAPYTFDAANQKVEMNYTEKADQLVANSEDYDAFYAKAELENVSAETPGQTVTLKRPFVQVMFMTNLNENMYGCPYSSTFATKAYPEFDLIAGEPTGDKQEVTFGANHCDQGGNLFWKSLGSNGYYFMVSSAYFLAKSESSLADCTMTAGDLAQTAVVEGDESKLVTTYTQVIDPIVARNIPVQANYRVCLIGNLLSKDVSYEVEVDPDFSKTSYYWASGYTKYTTELDKVTSEGGTYTVSEDETIDHPIYPHGTDVTIEIAEGKTLSFNTTYSINISEGSTLTIKGGTVDFPSSSGSTASFWISKGSSLVLDHVNVVSNGAAIYPKGDAAKVVINGGSIKAGTYGIGTNANSVDNYNVEISVEDAEINSDIVATFINIPGKLTLKNVKSHGKYFGLVARGGTVNVTDSEITSDNNGNGAYWNEVWETGCDVACAALTLGNRYNDNYYRYPTYVTLTNTTVTGPANGYAVYGWANPTAENGVWFTYDDDSTITGDQFYGSDNITVNGVATKTEGNPKVLTADE